MNSIITVAGVGVGIAIIIALAILFPLLFIWALNTLFPVLAIPYTLETWSAVILMQIFIKSKIEVTKTK